MTRPATAQAISPNTVLARTDVVRLLQEGSSSKNVNVSGQDLRGIDLMNCHLQEANLSHARVDSANLCGTKLSGADLFGTDLRKTFLCWADLQGANLRVADLRGADLSWVNLRGADLRGASLDGASLYGASLCSADLRGTLLDGVDVRGADFHLAFFGEASAYEQARDQLEPRGAIFSHGTNVKDAQRSPRKRGVYMLGFLFGLLSMSVVSFLGVLGIRAMLMYLRLKRDARDYVVGS